LPVFRFEIINYIKDNLLLAENLLSIVAVYDFVEGDDEIESEY